MDDDRQTVAATPLPLTPLSLTPATMRDRYVSLMKEYAALHGKPTSAFLDKIVDFQTRVSALGTSLSVTDERTEAQATINYWQTVRINAGERPETVLLGDFDHEAARLAAGVNPPYKGLAPFQTNDAPFFSGRFALVNDLVKMVKSVRLVALTGLSGSGKSSIIRAGLIPNLKGSAYDGIDDDGLTDSGSWDYPVPILPGKDPLGALVAAYGPITKPADLPMALDARATAVVLSVDQFEEVYNLSPDTDRRRLFLDALVAAATTGVHRHIVIITMRSEFDSFVTTHEAFSALFKAGRRNVEAMQASDLRKVIEEPANRLGVGFEPGLVDELMTRVQGEPAGLPLLSFTLLKLWEMRAGGPMKMADYQTLGGNPRDILANSADTVFEAFLKQDQDLARGIFTRLVKIGDSLEATSMRITRADLDVLGARDNVNRVLDILVDEGLLRTAPAPPERAGTDKVPGDNPNSGWWITPETQIEVAHEALIRNWGRLTEWVKDSFAEQTNRKAFALRAQKWKEGGGDLLSGMSLDEAKGFPDKSPVEAEYVAASNMHFVWRQRKLWVVTAVIAVLAIASSILSVRLIQIGKDREATRLADEAFKSAVSLVDRGDVPLAKKVLLESVPENADLPPRVQALLQAAALNTLKEERLRIAGPARPTGASVAADGTRLVSLWDDGSARVWTKADGDGSFGLPPVVMAVPGRGISAIALSPDGLSAVSASFDPDTMRRMYLDFWAFDPADATAIPQRTSRIYDSFQSDIATSIAYHPTQPTVIVALDNGGYAVVNTQSGHVDYRSEVGNAQINSAVFSPKGDRILTAADDGWIEVIDAKTHMDAAGPGFQEMGNGNKPATTARFSPTGARFAVGSTDGIIRIYQASDNQKLFELAGHRKGVTGIAFSSDGATLVSSAKDGTLRLWDLGINDGHLRQTLPLTDSAGHALPVNSVDFTADGEHIIAASNDGSIRVLDSNGEKLAKEAVIGKVTDAFVPAVFALSPDRTALITNTDLSNGPTTRGGASATRTHYELLDPKTGALRTSWETGDASQFYAVQLSADGTLLSYVRQSEGRKWTVEARAMTAGAVPQALADFDQFPSLVGVSPDGTTIVTVDENGMILGFDNRGGAWVKSGYQPAIPGVYGSPLLGAFARKGPSRLAIAITGDPHAYVYDLATGKAIKPITAPGAVAGLQFSPDGTGLFIATDSGSGAIYDAASGNVRVRLDGSHDSGITFATFSNDGKTLVTGSNDATARLWNVADGTLLQVFRGHKATLSAASFSPAGERLLTESDDRPVMLWDTLTGQQLTVLHGPAGTGALWGWFGPDGKTVQTLSSVPATLRTWNVGARPYGYADLRNEACKDGGIVSDDDRTRNSLAIESPLPKCAALQATK